MKFNANEGKRVEIDTKDGTYLRHAIQTHFVQIKENYIDLILQYVSTIYQSGDILSISEKVIALCQNRVVSAQEIKIGLLAHFLAHFAGSTAAGPGVSNVFKMQFAIDYCGVPKILTAAVLGGICRFFGHPGVFYRIAGREVSGLDGFYGDCFKEYENMGIRIPADSDGVCDEIYEKTGIVSMIVDANSLGVEILGKSSILCKSNDELKSMIRDNPSGQSDQLTPFILIRKKEANEGISAPQFAS